MYMWSLLASDEFPSPSSWPSLWRDMFFNSAKSMSERYRMFVFFWQNGMMPWHALWWTMISGSYDSSAWRGIFYAYRQTYTVAGRDALNRNRVFNLRLGFVA